MITVTKRFEFDAAHRLHGYGGPCANMHGHRYVVEVEVSGPEELDDLGMVVDFGAMNEQVGGWINKYWDHALLVNGQDDYAKAQGRVFVFEQTNPTAEAMADHLASQILHMDFMESLRLRRIRVYETPDSWAEVT